jgi:hypothetical protein
MGSRWFGGVISVCMVCSTFFTISADKKGDLPSIAVEHTS